MHAAIIQTRRFVLTCLALILASAFTALTVSAECSDYTTGGRDCTTMEQHGYCLTNAWSSYQDCIESGGIAWDFFGCATALDIDILGCTAMLPLRV